MSDRPDNLQLAVRGASDCLRGGGRFSEIVFFQTKTALENFKQVEFYNGCFGQGVDAVSSVAANAKDGPGVAVFPRPESGAMVKAAWAGRSLGLRR